MFRLFLLCLAVTVSFPSLAHEKPAPGGGVDGLDVHYQGNVADLLLVQRAGKKSWLAHQRSLDGGKTWGKATKVEAKKLASLGKMSRGSDAQIAAQGEKVVVLWTTFEGNKWGTGPLATAISEDGGKTWTMAKSPTDADAPDGQSYVDLTVGGKGTFHAVWLDSRDGGQGLRYASTSDPKQGWSKNETLVQRTCECCWNRILAGPKGETSILYREKDPRDMALYKKTESKPWHKAGVVGAFNWKFEGCPHVGGALATSGDATHALVWTAAPGKTGLYHVRSVGEDEKWSDPVRVGGEEAKHSDLAANGDRIAAVWDVMTTDKMAIYGSISKDQGKTWSTPKELSDAKGKSSHPRIVPSQAGFTVLWTERQKDLVSWRSTELKD